MVSVWFSGRLVVWFRTVTVSALGILSSGITDYGLGGGKVDYVRRKLVCGFCVKVMKLEEKVFFFSAASSRLSVGCWWGWFLDCRGVVTGCVCARWGLRGEWLQKVAESEWESVENSVRVSKGGNWVPSFPPLMLVSGRWCWWWSVKCCWFFVCFVLLKRYEIIWMFLFSFL